jgi:hypothetical protein
MTHHARIQVGDIDITMPEQRYIRLLRDEITAVVEHRGYIARRNAVITYAFASVAAIAAMLIAANGLIVH